MMLKVRAVIEGQLLSMRAHAERFGLPVPPRRVVATGGASANHSILRAMASIFGCAIYTVQRPGKHPDASEPTPPKQKKEKKKSNLTVDRTSRLHRLGISGRRHSSSARVAVRRGRRLCANLKALRGRDNTRPQASCASWRREHFQRLLKACKEANGDRGPVHQQVPLTTSLTT